MIKWLFIYINESKFINCVKNLEQEIIEFENKFSLLNNPE